MQLHYASRELLLGAGLHRISKLSLSPAHLGVPRQVGESIFLRKFARRELLAQCNILNIDVRYVEAVN